jgi:hypothetical protein
MVVSKGPRIEKTNDDLIRDWNEWVKGRGGKASLEDVLASGDSHLLAGMLLKGFRKVTRQAMFDRFKPEARKRGFSNAKPSTGSFFFMVDCVASAWALTDAEKLRLLGLESAADLDALRDRPFQDISPETLERAGLLLDIFIVLNAIFPQDSADRWIQASNKAPLFGGKSALATMMEGGVASLKNVKLYLWDEVVGN